MIFSNAYSQVWVKGDSIILDEEISAFSVDQNDDLYLGTTSGSIFRYDSNGSQKPVFSEINYSSVTTIETWNRLKTLLFYRENQVIVFLDRFSTYTNETSLIDLEIGFGKLAIMGVDNSLWVLESNNNELRKYSINGSLDFVTPLGGMDLENASQMRAYKNILIILDFTNGFFFFDQFGNPLSQLPMEGAQYFQILENRVITYDGEYLIEFNPFLNKDIFREPGPEGNFVGVLKAKDTYIFVGDDRIIKMNRK